VTTFLELAPITDHSRPGIAATKILSIYRLMCICDGLRRASSICSPPRGVGQTEREMAMPTTGNSKKNRFDSTSLLPGRAPFNSSLALPTMNSWVYIAFKHRAITVINKNLIHLRRAVQRPHRVNLHSTRVDVDSASHSHPLTAIKKLWNSVSRSLSAGIHQQDNDICEPTTQARRACR
jgi:hypothetical protein